MTTHPGQTITPPPSLDDILATSTSNERIGRIDFTAPLVTDDTQVEAPPAALEQEPEPVAEQEPEPEPVAEAEPVAEPEPEHVAEAEPEPVAEAEPDLLPAPVDVALPTDSLTEELPHLAVSVAEIAATVTERMRRAGEAHVRHLEAVELETARRCELVTAQAELDAELIRLHARREAHAIITAARMRTGGGAGSAAEGRLLSEINTTLSRFAESIETAVTEVTEAHDPLSPS